MPRDPVANERGVPHLYVHPSTPPAEAAELRDMVESMTSKNTDHAAAPVFNPAVSRAQQQAMAIAEHQPSKLHAANRGMLKMSKSQLHDFAATKGLKK